MNPVSGSSSNFYSPQPTLAQKLSKGEPDSEVSPIAGKPQNLTLTRSEVTKKLKLPELNFYKNHIHNFKDIAPDIIRVDEQNSTVLMLNIGNGMEQPHLIDIKIGDLFANEYYLREVKGVLEENILAKMEKRRNVSHYSGFSEHNYRIAGYTGQDKSIEKHDWLRENARISPRHILTRYFNSNAVAINKAQEQLVQIAEKLQAEPLKNYALISSSVLIAFDKMNPENVKVRIIDFNNAMYLDQGSSKEKQNAVETFNVLFQKGLHNLVDHLKSIVHRAV